MARTTWRRGRDPHDYDSFMLPGFRVLAAGVLAFTLSWEYMRFFFLSGSVRLAHNKRRNQSYCLFRKNIPSGFLILTDFAHFIWERAGERNTSCLGMSPCTWPQKAQCILKTGWQVPRNRCFCNTRWTTSDGQDWSLVHAVVCRLTGSSTLHHQNPPNDPGPAFQNCSNCNSDGSI